jgi:exodeoxyribonuclease III
MTKIISWNVNGIRAILKKNFLDYLTAEDPDILCIQEIKARQEQVELSLEGYHAFWNSAERPGYSGTLTLSKIKPVEHSYGINSPKHDQEGRVISVEFPTYILVNVYTPNSGSELKRLTYRQEWDTAFKDYVSELAQKKPVLICGDLNVAHNEIDLARPDDNHFNAGFTDEEREGFNNLLDAGFIDTFRVFNQEPGQYSWWSYRTRARERGIGWRIDYFCASQDLKKKIKESFIREDIMGSDHCPVGVIVE